MTDGGELGLQDELPIQATHLRNMDTGLPLNTYVLETPKYWAGVGGEESEGGRDRGRSNSKSSKRSTKLNLWSDNTTETKPKLWRQ